MADWLECAVVTFAGTAMERIALQVPDAWVFSIGTSCLNIDAPLGKGCYFFVAAVFDDAERSCEISVQESRALTSLCDEKGETQ
jgi:hypothetical protein